VAAASNDERVLYSFKGVRGDGAGPNSLIAVNGTFYGTTDSGGTRKGCQNSNGCGTVFQVDAAGAEHVIYRFKGIPDGMAPSGGMLALKGALYGTTHSGGENDAGTVFVVNPATGAENVVYSFKGQNGDGAAPSAGLIAVNGALYGTTVKGGGTECPGSYTPGCGTVFTITRSGKERVLHTFTGGTTDPNRDGGYPSGLIAMNGMMYGTTASGGGHYSNEFCSGGCGTVFEISPSGNGYRVLYRFKGNRDGSLPEAGLVGVNGKLYGTTIGGGGSTCDAAGFGCGTAFELTTSGVERILHRFTGSFGHDGGAPGKLTVVNGVLYGTTSAGGSGYCEGYGCGTVFKLSTTGAGYAVLHAFTGYPDGAYPSGSLIDVKQLLYGTTQAGGANGTCRYGCFGTVFTTTP
jgi:uncharacterized repeat protein (TIGR03803 family)